MLVVSKTASVDEVRELAAASKHQLFGEGRVQSLRDKASALSALELEWHFIGPLQTNKVRECVKHASFLHSLDRLELAEALDRELARAGRSLDVLIQVNASREASKQGVAPEHAAELVARVARLPTLRVRGLMTMADPETGDAGARACFRELRQLAARIGAESLPGVRMDELSMGMSSDYRVAIEEGATLLRIGSLIFPTRLG
jgi:pyridoxal phosphate enzyme (YggS family)